MCHSYTSDWNKRSLVERRRADFTCQNCDRKALLEPDLRLEVHHIDGNKRNNDPMNLVVLCLQCHRVYQKSYRPGQLTFLPIIWVERQKYKKL